MFNLLKYYSNTMPDNPTSLLIKYQELTRRNTLNGVHGLTIKEEVEMQELHQLAKREGLADPRQTTRVIKEMEELAKKRMDTGLPPLTGMIHEDKWDWIPSEKKYQWHPSPDGNGDPKDYVKEVGLKWKPEILQEHTTGPEGNPQSKI